MHYQYKGKRYKLNLFPILLILVLLIGVVAFLCYLLFGKNAGEGGNPASAASTQQISNVSSADTSSAAVTGGEPEDTSSEGVSSTASSEAASSKNTAPSDTSSKSESGGLTIPPLDSLSGELPAGKLSDWNLILLNPEEKNKIDNDLTIKKTKFDTQWVDSRAGEWYQKMYDAAKADGITLYLRSGFRSISTQRVNYNAEVQRYRNLGKSEAEAIRLTQLYYTVPGHSEHHTGLAFDIITPEYHTNVYTLNEAFMETDAYEWLVLHCTDYGFVLRYPKDKTDITQINFEPWHYRYVGVEHAKFMEANNLCLEEYVAILKEAGR